MIINPKILTVEEYERVVEAKLGSKDFKIVGLKEAGLEQRVGFLADHSRVQVEVELPDGRRQTLAFFAKGLPANENCRGFVEENGSFEKERFFYDVLSKHFDGVPVSAKTFPTCYLSRPDLLVLEDMGPQGFAPVKSTFEAVDVEHCQQVLAAMARFHSASIATEETLKRSLHDAFPDYMYEVFFTEGGRAGRWCRAGLQAARAALPLLPRFKEDPAAAQRMQAKFQGLGAVLLDSFQVDPRRRNVMCHGDSWISNFLFKYQKGKPEQALLLDFQFVRYAPPLFDVQLFLHKSLPYSEGRARQTAHLLRFYYECLQTELRGLGLDAAALLPEEEFLATSRDAARMASIVVVLYAQTCDMPGEFIDKVFGDDRLYKEYMFEDDARTEHVTKTFHADKHFRYAFGNALGHLVETLLADE